MRLARTRCALRRNGTGRVDLCNYFLFISTPKIPLKLGAVDAERLPMAYLRGKLKYLAFVVSRRLRGKKLPAPRRDFRVLGTVEGRDGEIAAVIQNISATGVCFVLEAANLPEEFMIRLNSPLEGKERRLRCRRVWSTNFESRGTAYIRVGCAFNEQSYRLRWLSSYLTDEFQPAAGPEVEAA